MSNLVEHAKRELKLLGNGPEIDEPVLKIVEIFSEMGHSGSSAAYTSGVIHELLQYKNLKPLTDDPEEWFLHEGHGPDGADMWQNKRNSEAFSDDGGKTYHLNGEAKFNHTTGKNVKGPLHTSIDHMIKEK